MVGCTSAPITLKSIFLVCHNLERSVSFYRSLGFREIRKSQRSVILSIGTDCELHLHEDLTQEEETRYGVGPGQGSPSLVLAYETSDILTLYADLAPENILAAPQTTPWGAKILMVRDPDGHRLEFRERAAS